MQQSYIWYRNNKDIDSPDSTHQILALGTLEDIQTLKTRIGKNKLTHIFLHYPKKIYTPQTLHFIKKFILHIRQPIHEQQYLKSTSRNTR
ncbi:MAG TPA: hypothetical protein VJB63_04485 [Patescibacteria group bacterium]|nr:hypothetical protein [Patescibacteria group bacterium]